MNISGSQCPFCGGTSLNHFRAHAHDATQTSSKVVSITECSKCIAAWQWPFQRSTNESVTEFEEAYTAQATESYFDPAKRIAISELQHEFISSLTTEPQKLLDIGCGDGCFAKIMSAHGWKATGLDPALPLSTEMGTANLIRGTFADLPKDEHFDLITLWDVVEHVENPLELISEAVSWLNPNGLLIVETGNYQSSGRITGGDTWWNYQLDHRWYLAPPQLTWMMTTAGLTNLHQADRVLRPWWKGQTGIQRPRLRSKIKSIVKNPFHYQETLQQYRQLAEGHRAWGKWGGLEIMTIAGRRLQ